jgi:hypothetical protein
VIIDPAGFGACTKDLEESRAIGGQRERDRLALSVANDLPGTHLSSPEAIGTVLSSATYATREILPASDS